MQEEACRRRGARELHEALDLTQLPLVAARLRRFDDPAFWECAIQTLVSEIDGRWAASPGAAQRIFVGLFEVLEWQRPHQTRWILGGGFAAPETYRNHADQQARWQVWLSRHRDGAWREEGSSEPRTRSRDFAVRVALPGRTRWHNQAAVAASWRPHAPWMGDRDRKFVEAWYGFRYAEGTWSFATYGEASLRST